MTKSWLKKGFSLIEILGAATVAMALASVAVISVKDSLKAGQRSAIQREIQSLNTALNNFKAAGGVIHDGSLAEDAVRRMRYGVGVSDMENYAPLTEDPDWLKKIGGETFRLDYNENNGFAYVPDSGEGEAFGDGGRAITALGPNAYDFDPSNRNAALDALNGLSALNPEDPAFGSHLDGLNAAYELGTLTDEDMLAAGLVKYGNQWLTPSMAQTNYAQDALEALSAGGSWNSLNLDQQKAYANVYPAAAIQVGGALALNLIDRNLLTPQLVNGYADIGGTWVRPNLTSSNTTGAFINGIWTQVPNPRPSIPGSAIGQNYSIYVQTDPLQPAVFAGTVAMIDMFAYYGSYAGSFPNASIVGGTRGSGGFISGLHSVQTSNSGAWGTLSEIYTTNPAEKIILTSTNPSEPETWGSSLPWGSN